MNPITVYGDKFNLTIGRLWIENNFISDGSHRFSVDQVRRQIDKPVTIAIWENENAINEHIIVNEEDFLSLVHELQKNRVIELNLPSKDKNIVFRRDNKLILVSLGDILEMPLDFENFINGLVYLFPNGEVKCSG